VERRQAEVLWRLPRGQHALAPGHGLLPAAHGCSRILVGGGGGGAGCGGGGSATAAALTTAGTVQIQAEGLRLRLQGEILSISQYTIVVPQGHIRAAAQGGGLRLVQRVDFTGRHGAAHIAHRAWASHGSQQAFLVVGLDIGPGALLPREQYTRLVFSKGAG